MKKILVLLSITLAACVPNPYAEDTANKRAAGIPFSITRLETGRPNSAGGVDAYVGFRNLTDSTIKYVNFYVVPYNAVGDRVSGEIRRRSLANLRETGPIEPLRDDRVSMDNLLGWGNVWYNYTITCMEVTRIRVEFMNGSVRNYSNAREIAPMLHPSIDNDCSV